MQRVPRPLYFDACALVKRYVHERGSDVVAAIIGSGEFSGVLFTSRLTHVEVLSALNRKARLNEIDETQRRQSRLRLDGDMRDLFGIIEVGETIIERVIRLLYMEPWHRIGAVDALHLESAREAWLAMPERFERPVFITSDRDLKRSARTSFVVFDPERDNPDLL